MAYETAPATPERTGSASGPRAGFWQRVGAYLIDGLIIGVPIVVLAVAVPDLIALIYVLGFVAQAAYFTLLEGGPTGQTIGKRTLGIRVYDINQGGPIGYGRAFIRFIGRLPSGWILALGYLWMLWDGEKQTWHDKFASSVVVPTDAYPAG